MSLRSDTLRKAEFYVNVRTIPTGVILYTRSDANSTATWLKARRDFGASEARNLEPYESMSQRERLRQGTRLHVDKRVFGLSSGRRKHHE